eukprot:TRINITY_DN15141_c0_g2_i3.p1 TRINITY_DN15141_c0_g2~~TRINITY_DN15141_c0_g2_i3.p1  ORF type:complete len:1998 (-),score=638.27 TRINITY_DN15141_c0_g2_i3:221-6076(-)
MDDFNDDVSQQSPDDDTEGNDNGSNLLLTTETGDDDDQGTDEVEAGRSTSRLAIPREELASMAPPEQLEAWRKALLPSEVDLITELDGSSLFFISVESVIFDLLCSKQVAFVEETQFLCLTHAIEQLLHSLSTSGGVFRLIFFDCMSKLFSVAFGESVWAFRQAFLVHCRQAGIDHRVFSSWYAPEWREHCAQWRPSFFLLADDVVELEEEEEDEDEDEEEAEKAKKERELMKGFFHALILRILSSKTHAVMLQGLSKRGNRMLSFAVEPDCYDGFIDHSVGAVMKDLFVEDEEEEEEEDEPIAVALKNFVERCAGKLDAESSLRSFFSVRFAKTIFKMCEGESAETMQLSELMVKALFLHDVLVRQIPLQKRAYATPAGSEWDLFENQVSGSAFEQYFTTLAGDLGKLLKGELPEGVTFDTACDLFDGRLYRHIFRSIVAEGLEAKKNEVDAKYFGLESSVGAAIECMWKEVGSKAKFFPINMARLTKLPGIAPPELPEKLKAAGKPQLVQVENELLQELWEGEEFTSVKLVEEEPPVAKNVLWENYDWDQGGNIDSLLYEETMEMNEGEKRMQEYLKAKGKITAKDLEYQRKFQLKKRQLALRKLSDYAKSLTGSDKLHHPIIMREDKDEGKDKGKAKKEEEKKEEKLSKKHLEILEKRKAEEEAKIQEHDKNQMKQWETIVDDLEKIIDVQKMEKELLDNLCGFHRITDSFVGFPSLSNAFKTSEAQCKVLVKVVKAVRTALKKMQLDRVPQEKQPHVLSLVRYFFCILQEGFRSFGSTELDGKGIKLFQECLHAIGFPKTADAIFEAWKEAKAAKAASEAAAAAAAAPAADDKKKGKDDKKKDKDDKKDKKDDKDAAAGGADEKELDSYKVTKEVELCWSGVGPDEQAFQLMHMGQYMTRTVGTAKDPKGRVNFKPDAWQKDLLDIVDEEKSGLVVAPTASGKTFIGYYVMDKVLRTDNDGVAVYVAPSKALVNQVSAEIYARFSSKTYPPHSKHELLGVFQREFNTAGGVAEQGKWKNCQVLVTVPHILEMLLLSPNNQDWVKRLRWVIFDEVHCIGEQEGGVQWEHTMQAIPCPFIALSATVADPGFFHSWLQRVSATKKQSEVSMIRHTERWNDLYKYVFVNGWLRPLHPFCCLIEQSVKKSGFSADLSLTPREMIQLFQEVRKIFGKNADWEKLAPKKHFGKTQRFVTKLDARAYERELKASFLELLRSGAFTEENFAELVLALQRPSAGELDGVQGSARVTDPQFAPPPRTAAAAPAEGDAVNGKAGEEEEFVDMTKLSKATSYLQAPTLLSVCRKLDEASNLPAIFFNFNRKEIERMLAKLIQELKDRQYNKYYGTEDASYRSKKIMEKRMAIYKQKLEAWEQAQKMKASKNQEANAARKNADEDGGRGAGKAEAMEVEEVDEQEPEPPIDIADEIDPEFTFHSAKALGQWQEAIEETMQRLKKGNTPDHLIDALRRGIGMHHEGCRKDYKQEVEILFRRGFLRVVFATGTLALGINMPCRSTVFCGDSLELNGLMFRQMSGRAGRRGFDLQGQVVFLDMAFSKVQRLIASDLSKLTGEFILSPTTVLRAIHQWELVCMIEAQDKAKYEQMRDKADLARCLVPMFSLPFFRSEEAGGDSELQTQVLFHTRFSIELLLREGLIGSDGGTRNLANLVSHLFEAEPANLVLSRILTSGVLHQYLVAEKKKERKGDRRSHLTVKLTAVLAWLFFRKRLPRSAGPPPKRKKHLPSEACPALPPLPSKIRAEVLQYNARVFEVFQQLATTVSSSRKIGADDLVLPYTQRRFQTSAEASNPFEDGSSFGEMYKGQINKYLARSPFAALAGKGDAFESPGDLLNNSRSFYQIGLNSLALNGAAMADEKELEATNSWILDFMIHGKMKYLYEDNGISPTKSWNMVSAFKDIIKMATAALKAYSPKEDIVLVTFTALGDELEKLLKGERSK